MADSLFESVVFESAEEIQERHKARREERKAKKVIPIKKPESLNLTPIWAAYWSIDTSTPKKFEAWLRLRPPYEDIFLSTTPYVQKIIPLSIPGFKNKCRSRVPKSDSGLL